MSTPRDVIVIGAGAIGCSIAYHLGRRGISARVVDRESITWAVFTYAPTWVASERSEHRTNKPGSCLRSG